MKNILTLIAATFILTSCNHERTIEERIIQEVIINNTTEYKYDSLGHRIEVPAKPFRLTTAYAPKKESIYDYANVYTVDYGTAEYIDSIKCIRYNEILTRINELDKISKPCKNE